MLTAIHRRVERLRAGEDPTFVARLASGWAVMGDPQVLPGYCLLLPDPVVPGLEALAQPARAQFLADMAALGDAVLTATGALRINYAMFGNLEPALHAHVFPRYTDEAPAYGTAHPWAYDWSLAPAFDAVAHDALRTRLHAGLGRAGLIGARGRIHHLDLTVSELGPSTTFYDTILPLMGLKRMDDLAEGPLWAGADVEIGLQAARRGRSHDRYTPGLHHLAFAAATRADVDRLYRQLMALGVQVLYAPADYPVYCEGYYAVFFSDPDGIKLEYAFTPVWPA